MLKILLAVVIAGVALPAAAEPLHKVLASPLVEEGSDPDGCTPAISGLGGPSIWEVRIERLLLDGKALVETSREAEPNRFPLCVADQPVAKNAVVELPLCRMRVAPRAPRASCCASSIRRTFMSPKPMRSPAACVSCASSMASAA